MAGTTLSDITTTMSQLFTARLADQRNMDAIELNVIPIVTNETGQNIQWGAKFDGTRDVTNFAEGADVDDAEFTKTKKVPAKLDFGHYRAPAKVSDLAAILAQMADGSPDEIRALVDNEVKDSIVQIVKQIAVDFYVGDGTASNGNPNIVGLTGGAALATGLYAGINRATDAQWAGTVIGNGSVARPLTDDLLRQGEVAAFNAGAGPTNLILTTANIHRKYAGLFGSALRVNTTGNMPSTLELGTNDLRWSGMPVMRSSRATAGKLFMIGTDNVEFVIPKGLAPIASVPMNPMVQRMGLDLKRQYMLPIMVAPLANTGNSLRYNVFTCVQLRVKRPNAVVTIADISET